MGLNKVKIGSFVELYSEPCGIPNLTVNDVSGVNRDKEFFEPSKQVGADTSKYKVVPPNYFACNLMHVGRDVVLPIALNHSGKNKIVSPAYTVFRITDETIILKEYFFILLKSEERDRYFWFHTDSSIRDGMEWNVFCDVEIEIPDTQIQKKYVDIYRGMQENLDAMTRGIEQMQITCDSYMKWLIKTTEKRAISEFIEPTDNRNEDLQYGIDDVRGISIEKKFIDTKANMQGVSLRPYKIIGPNDFCYVTVTSRNGDKVSIALNDSTETYIVSSSYVSFRIKSDEIIPEYMFMFMRGGDFDRYARFNSWGSAREVLALEDLGRFEIPLPTVDIQRNIVSIFNSFKTRMQIVERLSDMQNRICPVLVRGSIEDGGQ
ncbi:MAG: restriction endonuclease subunit S [Oscillospiraceae bacterium]|nr:restriction endonuclease subunit S [Oscillospiraceae bacterium]